MIIRTKYNHLYHFYSYRPSSLQTWYEKFKTEYRVIIILKQQQIAFEAIKRLTTYYGNLDVVTKPKQSTANIKIYPIHWQRDIMARAWYFLCFWQQKFSYEYFSAEIFFCTSLMILNKTCGSYAVFLSKLFNYT